MENILFLNMHQDKLNLQSTTFFWVFKVSNIFIWQKKIFWNFAFYSDLIQI